MSQDLNFSISSVSETPAKTKIRVRNFDLIVDEPQELGGTNEAPNPVEYILAGYAGCINVVAHIVARELNFSLDDLKIHIDGSLNPNRLFGSSYEDRAGYKSISVNLETSTQIEETLRRQWLTEIENRCPVNDNLSNPTPIHFSNN